MCLVVRNTFGPILGLTNTIKNGVTKKIFFLNVYSALYNIHCTLRCMLYKVDFVVLNHLVNPTSTWSLKNQIEKWNFERFKRPDSNLAYRLFVRCFWSWCTLIFPHFSSKTTRPGPARPKNEEEKSSFPLRLVKNIDFEIFTQKKRMILVVKSSKKLVNSMLRWFVL